MTAIRCVVGWLVLVGSAFAADPPATKHEQSEEVKAVRKTAINVTFPSHGLTLHGWLYKPVGDGPFPVVIWNHGSEQNPIAHPELGLFYTRAGFAVFLPVREGHPPSPGKYIQDALDEYKATGKDQTQVWKKLCELQEHYNRDVAAAVEWVKKQPFADADRIVITGCSYGGIQTLLAAEKGMGAKAFVPFAPAAMSWANTELQKQMTDCVRRAKAPVFLIQAKNDYNIGPSETLGPVLKAKGGLNRSKVYPAFGTTPAEGHGGFACWEEGISIWGLDVLAFLKEVGVTGVAGGK
jgi:carboxymethylenebutenolidase